MPAKANISGKKRRGRHTTVIEAAVELVSVADRLPEVTGIQVGFIDPHARSRKPRLKIITKPGGLEVQVLGSQALQVIFLHTTEGQAVQGELEKIEIK